MTQQAAHLRILVVDDDAMTRELLCLLLAGDGYGVTSADSGDTALAELENTRTGPDVVLTDMQMPGICGAAI